MEAEEEERAWLMAEEEMRNSEEMRLKAEAEEQARLKVEEEACISELHINLFCLLLCLCSSAFSLASSAN